MTMYERWQWDENHPEGKFIEEPDGTLFVLGAGGERLEPTAWQRRFYAAKPDERMEMLKE